MPQREHRSTGRKEKDKREGRYQPQIGLVLVKKTELLEDLGSEQPPARAKLWVGPHRGQRGTSSPGTQLREVRLSAPGCPSGEGKELGEQEGLREEKKRYK